MRLHSLRRKRRNEYEGNQCLLIRPSLHLWCKTQDQNSWTTTAPILSHLLWCIWITLIPCQEDMTVRTRHQKIAKIPVSSMQSITLARLFLEKLCVGFQPAHIMAASLKHHADLCLNLITLISPHQSRWIAISNLLSSRLLEG